MVQFRVVVVVWIFFYTTMNKKWYLLLFDAMDLLFVLSWLQSTTHQSIDTGILFYWAVFLGQGPLYLFSPSQRKKKMDCLVLLVDRRSFLSLAVSIILRRSHYISPTGSRFSSRSQEPLWPIDTRSLSLDKVDDSPPWSYVSSYRHRSWTDILELFNLFHTVDSFSKETNFLLLANQYWMVFNSSLNVLLDTNWFRFNIISLMVLLHRLQCLLPVNLVDLQWPLDNKRRTCAGFLLFKTIGSPLDRSWPLFYYQLSLASQEIIVWLLNDWSCSSKRSVKQWKYLFLVRSINFAVFVNRF